MRDVPLESGIRDRFSDSVPVELLSSIELVSAWHSAGMKVPDESDVVANSANHVAFHEPSVTNTFGASQTWLCELRTEVFGSLPIRAVPIS